MIALRNILFWVFTMTYLVVCPLTILYALGYIVQPDAEQGFVKTGLIHLSTVPPGASVYVEHRRYTQQTPTVIPGLFPGTYHLNLILKDHEPWIHTVVVEAEKATVLDKILLLPKTPKREKLLPDRFEELLPLQDTRFVLLAKGPNLGHLMVYDWQTGDHRPVVPIGSPFQSGEISGYVTRRGSSLLLVKVRLREGERFVASTLQGDDPPRDLTKLFLSNPLWVDWDPRDPRQLFAFEEGAVNRLDIESMAIYPRIAERVRGYGIVNSALHVLTEELALQRVDREGRRSDVEMLFSDSMSAQALVGAKGLLRMVGLSKELFLVVGERGELFLNHPPFQLVEQGVRGFEFNPRHQRLLVWRKDRLGIVELSTAGKREALMDPPALRWVVQGGRDIEQGVWVYEGSHVLFRDGHGVFLLGLEAPGEAEPQRFLDVQPGSSVAYSEHTGQLYYLDREDGRFSAMEIMPRKPPPPVMVPEPTE